MGNYKGFELLSIPCVVNVAISGWLCHMIVLNTTVKRRILALVDLSQENRYKNTFYHQILSISSFLMKKCIHLNSGQAGHCMLFVPKKNNYLRQTRGLPIQ